MLIKAVAPAIPIAVYCSIKDPPPFHTFLTVTFKSSFQYMATKQKTHK